MRTSRRSPARELTRSQCSPAQLMTKSAVCSPFVVPMFHSELRRLREVTFVLSATEPPVAVISRCIPWQTFS